MKDNSKYQAVMDHEYVDIGQNVLLHVGHFKYTVGVGPIEVKSFEDGLIFGEMLKNQRNKNVQYRVLVDDIGIDLEKRKLIKKNFKLPTAYRESIEKCHVHEDEIEIFFESSVRNYASRILSRKKVPGIVKLTKKVVSYNQSCEYERCVPQSEHAQKNKSEREIYSIIDPYSGIPLILKEGANPKCNMIIACSYYRGSELYDSIISFYNAVWEQRMFYGAMVSRELFEIEKPIIDFYYYEVNGDPKVVIHGLKEYEFLFNRRKMTLVKRLLSSGLTSQLKDNYLVKLEEVERLSHLKNIEQDISNLCV